MKIVWINFREATVLLPCIQLISRTGFEHLFNIYYRKDTIMHIVLVSINKAHETHGFLDCFCLRCKVCKILLFSSDI